jgi:NADH-quinone oxidoreductase subunit J
MNGVNILFFFFIVLAAATAAAILFSKNVFKSALFLLLSLLSVAALYVLSFAEFVAVAQILVYAGGILVIIIFGIMLTTKISGRPLIVENTHIVTGGITGITFLVLLIQYLPSAFTVTQGRLLPRNISAIAFEIFSEYSVAFEIAGFLLLIALIGAAVITSNVKTKV